MAQFYSSCRRENFLILFQAYYINGQKCYTTQTKFYKYLYKIDKGYELKKRNRSSIFLKSFDNFIHFLAKNVFKESLVYQSKPTLRIMFPNNKAVGDFHRDREYNHPLEEINIWVPITSAFNTNTIWIESEFDKADYSPMNLNFGQAVIFDSGLTHGNKVNIENLTRMSLKKKFQKLID